MKSKKVVLLTAVVLISGLARISGKPWNEEGTSQLGHVTTAHSAADVHSTIHYDLTRLLAVKAGLTSDMAETLARYCVLVDQINPKSNYPYPIALNSISIPDTYAGWNESLAGTERGSAQQNSYKEYPPQYWHFPYRDPSDTISGGMTFGISYPLPENLAYRDAPYFWRVPLLNNYNLLNIRNWALFGTGNAGAPDNSTPCPVYFYDNILHQYKKVQPGSIQAMGIYLHSLADSYSHEHCMVTDTLRSHPTWSDACGLTYHSHHEFAYDTAIVAQEHATPCFQALWRAIMVYKTENNITTPALWSADTNGFQDGDGIPDELENDQDMVMDESFLEKWEAPTDIDFNEDGLIDHFDHTSWRIYLCNNETAPAFRLLRLKVFLESLYADNYTMQQSRDENGNHFPGNTADQLIVELHNAGNYNTIVYADTLFVFSNGKACLFVPVAVSGSYYITLRHRNSIATVSASPVIISALDISYDFTDSAAKAYGDNMMALDGIYALFTGDVNQDGVVDGLDMIPLDNMAAAFGTGYLPEDLNGDGSIDALDMILLDNNSAAFISSVSP
jgi:hypothetical protein